jgi:ATP-dependent DNA helicase RecQ
MNHVVEVLTGADTDKVRKWDHKTLSTYGVGKEMSRAEWQVIGRQLMRLRYVRQNHEKFNVLELTDEGMRVLKQRVAVHLTKPAVVPEPAKLGAGDIACDEELFERLRVLRKRLADGRNVPAYIVFSDVTLRQMARYYPTTPNAFVRMSGVGEKKLNEFGTVFMSAISQYLQTNKRMTFHDEPAASSTAKRLNDTTRETLKIFRSGKSMEEIAEIRRLAMSTIHSHLLAAIIAGEAVDLHRIVSPAEQNDIAAAFARLGFSNLTSVYEMLKERFSYGVLRICRAINQPKGNEEIVRLEAGSSNPKPSWH